MITSVGIHNITLLVLFITVVYLSEKHPIARIGERLRQCERLTNSNNRKQRQYSQESPRAVTQANIAGSLHVMHNIGLNETHCNLTSFVQWPGGNVFCAIWGSSSLHEGASQAPFDSIPRVHLLPARVIAICTLQSNGECCLAASFDDNTLHVFRVSGATLYGFQRVLQPDAKYWQPLTLLALPGGSLILCSWFEDASNAKRRYAIECCATQQYGFLAPSKRLQAQDTDLYLIDLLPAIDDSRSLRIVAMTTMIAFSAPIP